MSLTVTKKQSSKAARDAHHSRRNRVRSWLLTWEIYPILFVAAFLRLYRLDTTEFAWDQSVLYRLAYDAVHYGLIPVTSNNGSIFAMHPPLAIYFLMLPALFSADPLWAVLMMALFNVFAVLLTYIFTRRYYGRLAATLAALLFAAAETSIVFSRFIWQPTLLAPFVLLFLFALFWGIVERRQGWLFPALLLLGVMYQLHEITLVMTVPLLVALLLAPWRTIRLRDVVLAFVFLVLIFAPYLIWEANTKFADIHTILGLTRANSHIDSKALTYYVRFLNPFYYDDRFLGSSFYDPVGSASSLVFKLLPLLTWARQILLAFLLGGFVTAAVIVLRTTGKSSQRGIGSRMAVTRATDSRATARVVPTIPRNGMFQSIVLFLSPLRNWWRGLRADPQRCGLLVLLAWQIVPVLILSRHSATVHLHYLLMILPGPFIIIGFFIAGIIAWLKKQESGRMWKGLRYGTYAITVLILIVQLVGSTASLIDKVNGINNHIFGYNDLGSLQHALREADQVALQNHLNRVFISASTADNAQVAMPFLAEQMRTPATLFDPSRCLVLPKAADGPAVFLFRSTDQSAEGLLSHFTTASLVDQPPLLGTAPFQLYIATPNPQSTQASPGKGFVNHLQLLDAREQQLNSGATAVLATRWMFLRSEPANAFTTYTYIMRANTGQPGAGDIRRDCMLTSIRAGDQLVTTFPLSRGPASIRITSQFMTTAPYTFSQGVLRFETFNMRTATTSLQTDDGSGVITLSDAPP